MRHVGGASYPRLMDLGPRPTDAEMDDVVAELREAGLLTIGTDAEGQESSTSG